MVRRIRRRFSTFSQRIQNIAMENARRQARGQRITQFDPLTQKFSDDIANALFNLRLENPTLDRDINRAKQAILGRTAGEFARERQLGRFKRLGVKPTVTVKTTRPKIITPKPRRVIAQPTDRRGRFVSRVKVGAAKRRVTRAKVITRIRTSPRVFAVTDVLTLGGRTVKQLERERGIINKDVIAFNKQFGGKELTADQFARATKEGASIDKRLASVQQKTKKFESSALAKAAKIISPKLDRTGDKRKALAQQKKDLPKTKEKLAALKASLDKIKGKKGIKASVKRIRLKVGIRGAKDRIKNVQAGKVSGRVDPGVDFPIIPASFIPKSVKFVEVFGASSNLGKGKQLVNLKFVTNTGRTGFVQGVTIQKGKKVGSVIVGQSGRKVLGASGNIRFGKIQSFVGRSLSKAKAAPLTVKQTVKLKGSKKLITISKNIRGVLGKTAGQTVTFKGERLPQLLGKKRLSFEDIAVVSSAIKKGLITKIASKSISGKGARAKFLATILGSSQATGKGASGGKAGLKIIQNQQFKRATQEVVNLAVASIIKAGQKPGIKSKKALLAAASTIIAATSIPRVKAGAVTARATLRAALKKRTKATGVGVKVSVKPKVTTRATVKQRARSRSTTKQAVKVVQKPKTQQKQIPRSISRSKQRQTLRSKTLQRQQQIQQQQLRTGTLTGASIQAFGLAGIAVPLLKKKKLKKLKIVKTKKGFNVFAKPVKGKKLVKINLVPLTKKRARDLRNFIVDTSLSRTGRISKTKRKPQSPKLKVPKGYARRTTVKFRRFKTVKGKRKLLPKGKVIERRKRLLDTRQEQRKIGLRKRLKQLKKARRKRKR